MGHGAHLHAFRHDALALQEVAFPGRGAAMGEAEFHVAAQQAATIAFQPGDDRRRQRADAGDHRDAQGQAGNEQAEAAQAAAQLAQGKPQRQHHTTACRRCGSMVLMRPSSMRTT